MGRDDAVALRRQQRHDQEGKERQHVAQRAVARHKLKRKGIRQQPHGAVQKEQPQQQEALEAEADGVGANGEGIHAHRRAEEQHQRALHQQLAAFADDPAVQVVVTADDQRVRVEEVVDVGALDGQRHGFRFVFLQEGKARPDAAVFRADLLRRQRAALKDDFTVHAGGDVHVVAGQIQPGVRGQRIGHLTADPQRVAGAQHSPLSSQRLAGGQIRPSAADDEGIGEPEPNVLGGRDEGVGQQVIFRRRRDFSVIGSLHFGAQNRSRRVLRRAPGCANKKR